MFSNIFSLEITPHASLCIQIKWCNNYINRLSTRGFRISYVILQPSCKFHNEKHEFILLPTPKVTFQAEIGCKHRNTLKNQVQEVKKRKLFVRL